jgi:exopolysaccharide biosynthesis polyprenyl glycosylphosphotransferase
MRHAGDAATPRLDDLTTARQATRTVSPSRSRHRRGWYIRRALVLADVSGLSIAFVASTAAFADRTSVGDHIALKGEALLFLLTLPVWVVLAKTLGLYERDDARADHSTADETFGVINLVTLGTWLVFVAGWVTGAADPELDRAIGFWALAVALVSIGRIAARTLVRQLPAYAQRGIVIGAGHVGQLVARKIAQHPEYGIELVGFVDENPRDRRAEIAELPVLGGLDDLARLVSTKDVERVIVAFSGEPDVRTMALVRSLRDENVIVDLVPRLFELVGPRADIHLIEGMPLLTVPPARLPRSSRVAKRAVDLAGATTLLLLTSPIFLVAAIRIRMESAGPVFFRQTRLGTNQKPFTVLKFRTMKVDTDDAEHRAYIEQTMSANTEMNANGTYKLSRENAVTPFGRLLRKTSLDELPQLINVLRGDMSLVGPRPCIPYETEFFEPHHFDRFLVPQGITGLWQVTARAKSTFGEALEMDVAYVRGWSIGLDLRLLLRTPFALLRQRKATR